MPCGKNKWPRKLMVAPRYLMVAPSCSSHSCLRGRPFNSWGRVRFFFLTKLFFYFQQKTKLFFFSLIKSKQFFPRGGRDKLFCPGHNSTATIMLSRKSKNSKLYFVFHVYLSVAVYKVCLLNETVDRAERGKVLVFF